MKLYAVSVFAMYANQIGRNTHIALFCFASNRYEAEGFVNEYVRNQRPELTNIDSLAKEIDTDTLTRAAKDYGII